MLTWTSAGNSCANHAHVQSIVKVGTSRVVSRSLDMGHVDSLGRPQDGRSVSGCSDGRPLAAMVDHVGPSFATGPGFTSRGQSGLGD